MSKDNLQRIEKGTGRLLVGPSHIACDGSKWTLCDERITPSMDVVWTTPTGGAPNIKQEFRCDECCSRQERTLREHYRKAGIES